MKRILITGASGFVGSHLVDHLLATGDDEIYGTYRTPMPQPQGEGGRLHFLQVDLQDRKEVDEMLDHSRPELIFHLAGQANVPHSFKDPVGTFHANIDSQLNLFASLKDKDMLDTKILLVSSAEVYGRVQPEDVPVDEETPHRPANPYAVSKIAQDYLGYQFYFSYKMPIIRVRPFNHVGPRQVPTFVVADFAKQIAEIEKEKHKPVMMVGNLDAKRDFTDVRDMVRLYPLLLEKGEVGEVYNAGSGTSRSAKDILEGLLALSDEKITYEQDPERMRPSDIPNIVANRTKVTKVTGWKPEIPFEKTLNDTLDYWRGIV